MLACVDADELTEWMAIRRMGFDEDYIYVDAAQANVCKTLANVHRSPDSSPYQVKDFLLWPQEKYRDPDEMSDSLLLAMDKI